MDMAFHQRAQQILDGGEPARLDHALLLAALAARQSSEPVLTPAPAAESEPLIELVLVGPHWREAAQAQGGCFSRAEAGRGVND